MGTDVWLWMVQALLALLFLFAGGIKLVLPAEALSGPIALPLLFLRFIGASRCLGPWDLSSPASCVSIVS